MPAPNAILERQFARLAALAEFELLQHPLNLESVLLQIVTLSDQLLPTTCGSSIVLWNAQEERFHTSASTVPTQETGVAARRVRQRSGASRWIVDNDRPVVVHNVTKDPFGANTLLQEYGINAYIGVPIRSEGRVVGVLYALDREARTEYLQDEMDFLSILASRAGSAIAYANLFAQVALLATQDPLTGLLNRRAFYSRADEEMNRANRFNHPLSVLIVDVDRFKTINDRFGHSAGDRALQHIAGCLRHDTRQIDLLARLGGEEFAVLLPETGLSTAAEVAGRLRLKVEESPYVLDDADVELTISIGVSSLSVALPTIDALTDAADEALYAAKHAGRNQVAAFTATAGIILVQNDETLRGIIAKDS